MTRLLCHGIQMFGIDEAALDNLSLVTEMTKHIRVRASQSTSSEAELGRFSPLFVWLLRVRYDPNKYQHICSCGTLRMLDCFNSDQYSVYANSISV